MSTARNKVIGGWCKGSWIRERTFKNELFILQGVAKEYSINKRTVKTFKRLTEENLNSDEVSILGVVAGTLFFGPVGVVAGMFDIEDAVYYVLVGFENGEQSLMELDDYRYRVLIKSLK